MNVDTFYDSVGLHPLQTSRLATVYRHAGRDWQDAESILFVHGNVVSSRWWEPTMAAFEELMSNKYACFAPDLRSHGEAQALPVQGIESFVQDIISVMDTIGVKQAHIVGWSMGGAIAMQLALDYPERCLSLVLVSSISPYGADKRYIPAYDEKLIEAIAHKDFESLAHIVRTTMLRENRFPINHSPAGNALFYYLLQAMMQVQNYPGDIAHNEGNQAALKAFNLAKRCAAMKLPILGLYGDADPLVSQDYWKIARRPWPAELYQEIVFAGAGHSPMIEQPRRLAIELDSFFSVL